MRLLSHDNYTQGLKRGLYSPSRSFHPYYPVEPSLHTKLKSGRKSSHPVDDAFVHLEQRVSRNWFGKLGMERTSSYAHAQAVAPAYEFLLPEIIADDWLATVGWHKKHYRDHVLHQPLTAYVVLELLTGGGDARQALILGKKSLLDHCVDSVVQGEPAKYLSEFLIQAGLPTSSVWVQRPLSRSLWKMLFVETAYIAALFHDLGYPWKYVDSLERNLARAGHAPSAPVSEASHLACRLAQRLVFAPFRNYSSADPATPMQQPDKLERTINKCLLHTHGLSGAVGFLYLFDSIRKYPNPKGDPVHQLCVEWAAMAILMHDIFNVYWGPHGPFVSPDRSELQVRMERDPLSTVLILADTIQEFCRPHVSFKPQAKMVGLEYLEKAACVETEVSYDPVFKRLTLSYGYEVKAAEAQKANYMKSVNLAYTLFDPGVGLVNLASAGINSVKLTTHHA